ncbi:MAG: type II methionyl aminopeptidase [Candidatus Diapherotrites archaeon]|nr:type II methionyl aminopeptidase [Candidatus Diapherotrites archaeon]
MDKKTRGLYIKSGSILSSALKLAQKNVKEGTSLLSLCERIESFIVEEGGKPAFPVNVSINHIAAHFTPSFDSKDAFSATDVAKIDIGVHIDGCITDSAVTIDLSGEAGKMLEASQGALEAALSAAKPGTGIGKLGETIEKEIKKRGFKPIQNLSGHGIEEWVAHASPSIPNTFSKDGRKLEPGRVYAIEPFATNGEGMVHEGVQAEIFGFDEKRPLRSQTGRKISELVEKEYRSLPFAERWLVKKMKMSEFERKTALRELLQKKSIHAYPVLRELEGKTVTQAETTILVEDKDITVLVK